MTNESDALNTVVAIAALHTIASGFTIPEAYREAARKAVTVLQDLANDRDEWKQQHENLLGVKEQDSAALCARIAALEAEVKRTRCPIKMDDARNLCSAGCCYACVCDRLRAATRTLGAADDREICPSGEGYARAGDGEA